MPATQDNDGLLIVDKPSDWTSHDVVARVRRLAGTRRVGHAGTLDPMATGVLVLGVNRATRLLTWISGADKDYAATIRLGVATTTDDAEGEVLSAGGAAEVGEQAIRDGVAALTGAISQVPSSVSAIKVDGKRAYARVRSGEQVELAPRPVRIDRFDIHRIEAARTDDGADVLDLDVSITCTSGTYVRALARDLGAGLGCGGHLTALRRTRVGDFGLDGARTLDELAAEHQATGGIGIMSMADAARVRFSCRELTAEEAAALGYGKRIPWGDVPHPGDDPVAAFAPDGRLVALLERHGSQAKPVIVFAPS